MRYTDDIATVNGLEQLLSNDHSRRYVTRMNSTNEADTSALPREVVINGRPLIVSALTLADLLSETGYIDVKVATARNGDFVPERLRDSTKLVDGDRIEILSPRQGG